MKFPKLTIEHLWIFLIFGACFGYVSAQPLDSIDFWHFMKSGEVTVLTKHIFEKDIFSFTVPDKQYVNSHWGAQVIFYVLYCLGGVPFIELIHALIITLSFVFLFLSIIHRTGNVRISLLATFIAFFISSTNYAIRPQAFSILFFTMTYYLLKTRKLWILPFIVFIWTNVHAAFVMGLALIGIEWFSALKLFGTDKKDFQIPLFATLVISSFATLINPWGINLYKYILTADSLSRISHVIEWESPSFHEPSGFVFYISLVAFITLHNISKIRFGRTDLFTFFVFLVYALNRLRGILWWSIILAPLVADIFVKIFLKRTEDQNVKNENQLINWAIALIFSFYLIGCLPWFKINNPLLPETKRQLVNPDTPFELTKELSGTKEAKRIFNDYSYGSYFIWALRKDQKVFYDPRVAIFPEEVIKNYFLVTDGYSNWQEILDYYKVDTLALSRTEQRELISLVTRSNKWKRVYGDRQGIIFVRR